MTTHSSTLAWKIPWMEWPSRLQSMGSLGVGHNWATSLSLFTFMHWRREWQPTPVFLPGESQGRGSLVGCRLWGCTESDTTEVTQQQHEMRVKVLPSLLTFREPLMRPQNSTSLKAQKVTGTWPPGDLENDLANVHHKTFQRLTVKHQSSFKKLLTYIFL